MFPTGDLVGRDFNLSKEQSGKSNLMHQGFFVSFITVNGWGFHKGMRVST
jgi:hypothetical protein